MKLYNERNPAPNPRRVRIFLAENGISIPIENIPLRERALNAVKWLNRELENREYIATNHYTMADVVALTTLDFAQFIGIELPSDCSHLSKWHAVVSSRVSAAA